MNRAVLWLRLEGAAALALSVLLYSQLGAGWLLFLLLFLAPDLSMIGYAAGPTVGARAYNLVHSHTVPLLLLGAAWMAGTPLLSSLGLIWTAHIGFDRMVGYGLKEGSGFQDTHLGRIGRRRNRSEPGAPWEKAPPPAAPPVDGSLRG